MGVILAFIIAASVTSGDEAPLALALENWDNMGELLGLAVFIFGVFIFVSRVLRAKIEIMDEIGCHSDSLFSRKLKVSNRKSAVKNNRTFSLSKLSLQNEST